MDENGQGIVADHVPHRRLAALLAMSISFCFILREALKV